MTIKIVCIGKTNINFVEEGIKHYLTRLKHYCKIEYKEIQDVRNSSKLRSGELRNAEGEMILNHAKPADVLVLLDENGAQFNSVGFSEWMNKKLVAGGKTMVIVIGGAYGFSDKLYAKADTKISLSKMTFNHQMVRVIALEQLYRALTILKGEPYHHS